MPRKIKGNLSELIMPASLKKGSACRIVHSELSQSKKFGLITNLVNLTICQDYASMCEFDRDFASRSRIEPCLLGLALKALHFRSHFLFVCFSRYARFSFKIFHYKLIDLSDTTFLHGSHVCMSLFPTKYPFTCCS